jgi:hypothetical protein
VNGVQNVQALLYIGSRVVRDIVLRERHRPAGLPWTNEVIVRLLRWRAVLNATYSFPLDKPNKRALIAKTPVDFRMEGTYFLPR